MDAAALAATHRAAFVQSRPWSAEEFTDLLEQNNVCGIGDARAFALIRVVAGEAELLTIATHPAHQRQGMARATLDRAHDVARAMDATEIFLEVAEDNLAARGLYAQIGYRVAGRRSAYYLRSNGTAADALVMRCDLTQG